MKYLAYCRMKIFAVYFFYTTKKHCNIVIDLVEDVDTVKINL